MAAQPAPEPRPDRAEDANPITPSYEQAAQHCVLCGAANLRQVDRDHRGHTITKCGRCGVRFMNPQYTDRWLEHYYANYVPASGHSHHGGWRARPEVRRSGKLRALQDVQRHLPNGRMLMVGCGDGLELGIARELGYDVVGQDVDAETCARVAEQYGIPVHGEPFCDLPFPSGSFDAVFLDQVIEHPKDPGAFLDRAVDLLRAGGVLYLGQPNLGSLSNRAKTLLGRLGLRGRRRGRHYASQHHITYYTPRVLTGHLRRAHGLEILAVRGSPKPSRRPFLDWLPRRWPLFDSSFVVLARRPSTVRTAG